VVRLSTLAIAPSLGARSRRRGLRRAELVCAACQDTWLVPRARLDVVCFCRECVFRSRLVVDDEVGGES
jgi:hypothetical protein